MGSFTLRKWIPAGEDPIRWVWTIPVLLALLINANVLVNGYGWDDHQIIANLSPDRSWFETFFAGSDSSSPAFSSYYRPLIGLSYYLDYSIWGGRPFGFHFSVWVGHILNTVLVFFLARRLQRAQCIAPLQNHIYLPLLASSLFAVNPAHAEAVAWIAGRNDVFCTLFMLASFLFYVHFHRSGLRTLLVLSMLSFVTALLLKETAVGLLFLFPLYDGLTRGSGPDRSHRAYPWHWLVPFLLVAVYLFVRSVRITFPYAGFSSGESLVSPVLKILEGIAAFGFYMKLLFFPVPHQPYVADLPSSVGMIAISIAALAVVCFWILYAYRRREVLLGTGLGWMLLALAPAVAIPWLGHTATPAAERYAYAASAGFLLAAVWVIREVLERVRIRTGVSPGPIGIVSTLLVICLLIWGGWESRDRNTVWLNRVTFWEAAVKTAPEAGIPSRELARRYADLGRNVEAERLYLRAIENWERSDGPESSFIQTGMGDLAALYSSQGRYVKSGALYRRVIEIGERTQGVDDPILAPNLHNLAKVYFAEGRYAEAESTFRRALGIWEKALGPDHPAVATDLHELGVLYHVQGRYDDAEPLYQKAIRIQERVLGPEGPALAKMLENLAVLNHVQERYNAAEGLYLRSLMIRKKVYASGHPLVAVSLTNLAELYRSRGDFGKAVILYEQAIGVQEKTLGSDDPLVAANLRNYAKLLRQMDRGEEAAVVEARAERIMEVQPRPAHFLEHEL